ncbi:hypothetical protein [uncultured Ferrovibrio sp.]|jgi:hypothetical protein|uniref:hypothetical protein n=1 Tax=uncultured Ferrovibrio sp. TaxID=1576913 RepID=UPI00260B88FE|nr:hypothetical protein [uncultured Ferrovibrio sp.]
MRGQVWAVVWAGAALACLVSQAASAQTPNRSQAPNRIITDDAQACISIANLTEYKWPVTIRRTGRVSSTVMAQPREVMRYCAPDRLKPDERIIVTLKSTWFPIGECSLKNRGTMEIYREKSDQTDSGETTKVKCYEGR